MANLPELGEIKLIAEAKAAGTEGPHAQGRRLPRGNSRNRFEMDRYPVTRLMEEEKEKLLNLDKILHRRVIGQDEAVRVSPTRSCAKERALRMSGGPSDPSYSSDPRASADRAEARALSEALFDTEDNMVHIDMSSIWKSMLWQG